jgi:hypothetical protein
MAYVTYENRPNPHVTTHRSGCNQIRKHGGQHSYGQGGYRDHATYGEAETYAAGTGLPVRRCSFCNPQAFK